MHACTLIIMTLFIQHHHQHQLNGPLQVFTFSVASNNSAPRDICSGMGVCSWRTAPSVILPFFVYLVKDDDVMKMISPQARFSPSFLSLLLSTSGLKKRTQDEQSK